MKSLSLRKSRLSALSFSLLFLISFSLLPAPAFAGSAGNPPTPYDEAYYVTLDYYGGLKESSIVKSYRNLAEVPAISDYGRYDSVTNMTDYTRPLKEEDKVSFSFSGTPPKHFYFEGKTDAPYEQLPWKLQVSYRLNGVPCRAEELPGKQGLIEILVDAVPNKNASAYCQNNLVLQAATLLDKDKLLSLEAPGAQVQTLGNLQAVVFLALPGEEQHFQLRIGADDFSFPGITFLMVPATLSQLDQVSDLRRAKEKVEDSAEAINSSMDILLNTLDNLSGSLSDTARGLSGLNDARETISQGKGKIYASADGALADLSTIADALKPLPYHVEKAKSFLTDSTDGLDKLVKTAVGLKKQLKETRTAIHNLQQDAKDIRDMVNDVEWRSSGAAYSSGRLSRDLDDMGNSVGDLNGSLSSMKDTITAIGSNPLDNLEFSGMTIEKIREVISLVEQTKAAYEQQAGASPTDQQLVEILTQELISRGLDSAAAQSQAQMAVGLWQKAQDPDFSSQLDLMSQADGMITDVNGLLTGVGGSSANVLAQLEALCTALGDPGLSGSMSSVASNLSGTLYTMSNHNGEIAAGINDLNSLGDILDDATKTLDKLLDQTEELNKTLDSYIPDAQLALDDAKRLSTAAVSGLEHSLAFFTDGENLMKSSGEKLDQGTQATLDGLEGTLDQTVKGLKQTQVLRNAKNTIKDLIDSQWDEHTGELNNILLADPQARPVSLTSPDNPPPESLQILLRTDSINADEPQEAAAVDESFHAQGSFFTRFTAIFQNIWQTVAGWFKSR